MAIPAPAVKRMRRRKRAAHPFVPLTMTWAEVAATVFRASESWLRMHISDFPEFPRPDRTLDIFAREAVEAWVRRRFALELTAESHLDAEATLIQRATQRHA
jgi:hypothetical protein